MEQFANSAATTLNGTITNVATTLVVTSAATFPTSGNFRILIDSEVMLVTSVSGTTFTVLRGLEGTTATGHNTGVPVTSILTAQALASSNWVTGFDLDFTALTTGTLNGGANGTFTFAGAPATTNYTWTKGNSANEVTHANIVNGSGLNFQPSSTSDYNGGTRTLPYVWLPFAQVFPTTLYPNFGWNAKLRMWLAIGTDNPAAQYDGEVFGMDSNSTGLAAVVKRGYGTSGPQGAQMLYDLNGGNANNFVNDNYTLGAANKTYMVEFESVAPAWFRAWRGTGLTAGQVFPALSTMIAAGYDTFGSSPNTLNNFATSGVTDPLNGMGLILGAQRAASGTSFSLFFLRLRLDYKFGD